MVSLHGSTADISDRVTGAPGTFESTVRGIDALLDHNVHVRLNFVFCQANRDDFPHFVDLVAARWPAASIVFSFVGSHTDVVPRAASLIPTFTEVMPSLVAGLARGHALRALTFAASNRCAGCRSASCPRPSVAAFRRSPCPTDGGGGEFVKAPGCADCAESYRCYGVRRGYAELYGTAELRPLGTASESAESIVP